MTGFRRLLLIPLAVLVVAGCAQGAPSTARTGSVAEQPKAKASRVLSVVVRTEPFDLRQARRDLADKKLAEGA